MKQLDIKLSPASIDAAIDELQKYQKQLASNEQALTEKLAAVLSNEAALRFTAAIYDGNNDVSVTAQKIKDGWNVEAAGSAVCFIEFGSGIYYNSAEPYPLPRPESVANIGQYGKHYGARKTWAYRGSPGTNGIQLPNGKIITHGNPAAMPMWYGEEEAKRRLISTAKEVFAND